MPVQEERKNVAKVAKDIVQKAPESEVKQKLGGLNFMLPKKPS